VHLALPQVQGDLARKHDRVGAGRDEKPAGEQLVDRGTRAVDVDVAPGSFNPAGRRTPDESGQRVPGLGADLGQQGGDLPHVGEQVGDLPCGSGRVARDR
jgi:hypothetical protein